MCITPLGSRWEDERCSAVEVLGDINVLSGEACLDADRGAPTRQFVRGRTTGHRNSITRRLYGECPGVSLRSLDG